MDAELVKLTPEQKRYLVERPSAHERKEQDIDGSLIELQIVSTLVRHGCSDDQVIDYFDSRNPPCYVEAGRGESWLQSLISTARNEERLFLENELELNSADNTHNTHVVENQHTPPKTRSYADPGLPFLVLKKRLRGEAEGVGPLLTQWYREIIEVSAGSAYTEQIGMSTARDLAGRLRKRGYVETERLPGNRQQVILTEKGRRAATPIYGRFRRAIPVRGALRQAPSEEQPSIGLADIASTSTDDPSKTKKRGSTVVRRRAPSPARKRRLDLARIRRHERINGHYRLSFRGNKIRYIQLLTPPEEWIGGRVWENLVTGFDAQKLETLSWIVAEDDPDADPISALVPPTLTPNSCVFALAAELEQHQGSYRVATYIDENGELLPRIGIVEQSWYNFFKRIFKLASPLDVLSIKGTGTKKKRMFEIVPVAERLPIEGELNLHSFLQTLDIDYHQNRLDQLPSGWFKMPQRRKELVWRLLGLNQAPLARSYMPL